MSFRQSDAKLYKEMEYDGILKEQVRTDVSRILSPLAGMGYAWDSTTQTLKPMGEGTLSFDTPWCHAKGTYKKNCNFDHHIAFNLFGIIPPKCLECWKVVATPNTFEQLMEMETIQKQLPYPCKCGIELRDYTPKHYGAYFYNCSFEEGRDKTEKVRELCDKHITDGKNIDVILKRGCTEFEMIKGPSPFWHMTPEDERVYEILEAYVQHRRVQRAQPELVKQHVKIVWALWAHANGDMTYQKWNGDKPLWSDYVKYHEGDIDGIKADLAIAKAQAYGKIPPDKALKFLQISQDFAAENDLPMNKLQHILGAEERPVLNLQTIPEYPDVVIGDHDELT